MKSNFDKNKIKIEKNLEERMKLYELAHAAVLSEANVLWNSSQVFLVANSFLAGFIGTNLTGFSIHTNTIGIFLLSVLGITISTLWFLSYGRTSKYYKFRIAQAREREPEGWMLLNGDAKEFSEGGTIEIKEINKFNKVIEQKYYFRFYERLSSLWIVRILAIGFIIFYAIIFINFFPWRVQITNVVSHGVICVPRD